MNALTVINPPPSFSMTDIERVAEAIAKGGLFGSRDPFAVLTLCLLAQAEGQHPAVVFRDYHIIGGKPAKKAEAMLRDFLTAGGKIEWHRLDDECADATFSHPAGGSARISWDAARVAKAQLGGNAMHKKYPRQMLRSRTISEGVRTVFPGATSGLYVPDEVATFDTASDTRQPGAADHGGVIDHEARQPDEPAPRQKLDGPHTSKTALRKAVCDIVSQVRAAETEDALEAIKAEHKRTINQALRDWPALINGDPNLPEDVGLKGAIEIRRDQLRDGGQLQEAIRSMKETDTGLTLANWMDANEAFLDTLSDGDRRTFDIARELHESNLLTQAMVTAG